MSKSTYGFSLEYVIVQKQHRGFASMSKAKRIAIARQGGKAAQAKGTAHTYTREEARQAGRIGGLRKR